MNIDTHKKTGILSSLIIILITVIYFVNLFYDKTLISENILNLLNIVDIISMFFLLYSASHILRTYNGVSFDTLIYIYIGIKIVYIILKYLPNEIRHHLEIYVVLFLAIFIILMAILIKILNIKNTEVNTVYLKAFIISYLIIIYSINTFFHYLPNIRGFLDMSFDETVSFISKIRILSVIPFILSLIFFIKPVKN